MATSWEYFRERYKALDVEGKTVLDIGGSIGDTAVFFAVGGAKRVVMLEPFPAICALARRNVEINGLSHCIEVRMESCGPRDGSLNVDPTRLATVRTLARASKEGVAVPMRSLASLVKELHIPSESVLKIDCEGAEYEIIESVEESTLRQFDQILLEYHYGLGHLVERLARAGFDISVTGPEITYSAHGGGLMQAGLILGRRSQPRGVDPTPQHSSR